MKQYVCAKLTDHKDIAETISRYQMAGWRFHTYQAVHAADHLINHYLLFEGG